MKLIQNIRGQIKALIFSSLPFILLIFLATTAHATPAILDVRDVDTPGADSVLHVGGLTEDVSGFVDRGDNQNWINVPQSLEGVDYIESAQNNADVSDDRGTSLLIEVDVAEGAVLYMFIIETQPVTPFPWMNFAEFGADWVDTGLDISWTSDGRIFNVWRTVGPLDAGTYNFRQMPVDSSFYGIAATFQPSKLLEFLISDVMNLNISGGLANSIDNKINTALQALNDMNQNNDVAAINALQALINAVRAQRGNQISEADADMLIANAQAIIDLLNT